MPTYGAILPALNAARYLPDLIAEIVSRHPDLRVLVVDDGSDDSTADSARLAGAEVAVHEVNKGKGEALKTGYAWAAQQGLDWVYTMDSDGQHLPAEMQGFQDAAAQQESKNWTSSSAPAWPPPSPCPGCARRPTSSPAG